MTKRFTDIVIISNVIMGLLLYLSSQLVLLNLSEEPHPIIITGFNIFSIYVAYAQGSSPLPALAWSMPNFPFYVFILFLVVNVYFMIKLQRSKANEKMK